MSRAKHLPLLLLALALLPLAAREARACSCGPMPTVLDSYEHADVVVVTRAVSVEKSEKAAPEGRMGDAEHYVDGVRSTTMRVERVYKGALKVGDEMVFAQGGGADCIWTFDEKSVGQQFLFYLSSPEGGSKVWLGFGCGRSNGLQGAADDMLYLNKLDKVRGKTRLSGTIGFKDGSGLSVGGRLLRITGGKKTYEVRTDANGVYEIYDLPPGKYTVEPEVPAGWKVDRFRPAYSPGSAGDEGHDPRRSPARIPVVIEAGRHTGLNIHFDIDNAVRGVIYDAEGVPMNGVCLDLAPADGTKGRYLADCTEAGGAFEIDEIPPGRYVLVVNDDGKVSSREPFGTFYYPNVFKREEATVFEIGLGDFVENVQIRVPKAVETITVEGFFLYSDGKPVVEETVEFKAAGTDSAVEGDARAETDEKGRFRIKILKGLRGELYGRMYTYAGAFENCPKLDAIIKKAGGSLPEIKTPGLKIEADGNLHDVELKYPFPGCRKAKD